MRTKLCTASCILIAGLLLTGCVTTSKDEQFQNTVYQTYKIAKKLDSDLGGTVTKLNETAADLGTRVEASDKELRALRATVEENQKKLDEIRSQLAGLTRVLSQSAGVTPPAGVVEPPAGVVPGTAVVEPNPGLASSTSPPAGTVTSTEPAPGPGITATEPTNAVASYEQAQKYFMNNDYETALKEYDAYLQRFPNTDYTANAQFWKAECHFRLAEQKNDTNGYQKSIEEYEKLRKNYAASPKAPFAMHNEAVAYQRLGQTQRCVELLKELVKNFPTSAAAERARTKLKDLGNN